jgi:hypothetical protein
MNSTGLSPSVSTMVRLAACALQAAGTQKQQTVSRLAASSKNANQADALQLESAREVKKNASSDASIDFAAVARALSDRILSTTESLHAATKSADAASPAGDSSAVNRLHMWRPFWSEQLIGGWFRAGNTQQALSVLDRLLDLFPSSTDDAATAEVSAESLLQPLPGTDTMDALVRYAAARGAADSVQLLYSLLVRRLRHSISASNAAFAPAPLPSSVSESPTPGSMVEARVASMLASLTEHIVECMFAYGKMEAARHFIARLPRGHDTSRLRLLAARAHGEQKHAAAIEARQRERAALLEEHRRQLSDEDALEAASTAMRRLEGPRSGAL